MKTRTREYLWKASKISALAGLTMSLSGCIVALPPAIQVASLALDGVSYATTGKSVTDHAISTVTDKDCAMMRGLKGEDICVVKPTEVAMLPDGTPAPMAHEAEVQPAADDEEFQAFSAAQENTGGEDQDEVLNASESELKALDMATAAGPML